jgi:hypothetical protein|tara:strand:- start:472 stop:768 length:297 start_codon:yes stop_codon:yes gene_type:complete
MTCGNRELLADTVIDPKNNDNDGYEEDTRNDNNDEQVIPLAQAKSARDVRVHSPLARSRGLPGTLSSKQHTYQLAFALTDYKLQGRTVTHRLTHSSDP